MPDNSGLQKRHIFWAQASSCLRPQCYAGMKPADKFISLQLGLPPSGTTFCSKQREQRPEMPHWQENKIQLPSRGKKGPFRQWSKH